MLESWVTYFTICGLFALACGTMARKRNRNVALWAVTGFLFQFLGFLVLYLVRPRKNNITSKPIKPIDNKDWEPSLELRQIKGTSNLK